MTPATTSAALRLSLSLIAVLLQLSAAIAQEQLPNVSQEIPDSISVPELPPAEETSVMLDQILAQPKFVLEGEDTKQGENVLERVLAWLNSLFVGTVIGGMGWQGVVVITLLLASVIYLLIRLYQGFAGYRARKKNDSAIQGAASTPDSLMESAVKAAATGDYRAAVRYVFNAAVKRVNLPASSLRTNYQLLGFIRRNHVLAADPLDQLIRLFEDIWYGGNVCGSAEYDQTAVLYRQFVSRIAESTE